MASRKRTRSRSRRRPRSCGPVYDAQHRRASALPSVEPFCSQDLDSSPNTNHPKLLAGSSSHDCTSARICDELHVYTPTGPTDWLALTVPKNLLLPSSKKLYQRNGAAMWHRWSWPALLCLLLQVPRTFLLPSRRASCATRHLRASSRQVFWTCSCSG